MEIPQEQIDELKRIVKEKYGVGHSDDDVSKAAYNFIRYIEIVVDIAMERYNWDQRLIEEPKGFSLEGEGRGCAVCRRMTRGQVWYDKNGLKCMNCQRALDNKVIPKSVCGYDKRKTWFSIYDLERQLGIKPQTAKKLIKEGKLKAREIKDENGGTYFYVFLNKENPEWIKQKTK